MDCVGRREACAVLARAGRARSRRLRTPHHCATRHAWPPLHDAPSRLPLAAGEAITFFKEDDAGQLRGIANVMKAAGVLGGVRRLRRPYAVAAAARGQVFVMSRHRDPALPRAHACVP